MRESHPQVTRQYRLAIFDCDGTLADTLPWMRSIFNELAVEHGFRQVGPEEYERFRDLHGQALLRELDLPLWKLPRVMSSMRRRMAEHTGELSLFPGTKEMLVSLASAGIQIAIASSNSRENVERVLGEGNAKLITHFACGISLFGKAGRLRQILSRGCVQKAEAIYIGDELRDGEAAAKAGIAFGAVSWGQHRPELLSAAKPAIIFSSVDQIAAALCREPKAARPQGRRQWN